MVLAQIQVSGEQSIHKDQHADQLVEGRHLKCYYLPLPISLSSVCFCVYLHFALISWVVSSALFFLSAIFLSGEKEHIRTEQAALGNV